MYLTVQDKNRPWWVQLTAACGADEALLARFAVVLGPDPAPVLTLLLDLHERQPCGVPSAAPTDTQGAD